MQKGASTEGGPGGSGRPASVVVADAASGTVLLSSTARAVVGRRVDELAQLAVLFGLRYGVVRTHW